ncbi:hypothetical protein Glove_140g54 [Diversispora epigaea]|uniref:Uncharacterized protein n=1 Tax=Diversispora epigaea TaxID=1348612 RepID=A0A397J1K8_9GLOM|nr:hypothetical protein Glove_140g54 [Diversispora epigaea]
MAKRGTGALEYQVYKLQYRKSFLIYDAQVPKAKETVSGITQATVLYNMSSSSLFFVSQDPGSAVNCVVSSSTNHHVAYGPVRHLYKRIIYNNNKGINEVIIGNIHDKFNIESANKKRLHF